MKNKLKTCRKGICITGILAVAVLAPGIASATIINIMGPVDNVSASNGSPIVVGDTLSAAFDVDLNADNSFGKNDLNNFSLTVGPASYTSMSGSDFQQFNGLLSSDGSMLSNLLINTGFTSVQGLETSVALQLKDGKYLSFLPPVSPSFSIIGTGSDTSTFGAYEATGGFNASIGSAANDVPEPSSLGLLGVGIFLMGLFVRRRPKQPLRLV